MSRQRYRIEAGEAAIEVCLPEPPTPELEAALMALARAAQVDVLTHGREGDIGRSSESRVVAIRRRAGLPTLHDHADD